MVVSDGSSPPCKAANHAGFAYFCGSMLMNHVSPADPADRTISKRCQNAGYPVRARDRVIVDKRDNVATCRLDSRAQCSGLAWNIYRDLPNDERFGPNDL